MSIKKEGQLYVLYDSRGHRLFKSESYATVVEHQRKVEQYKIKAREKRKNK